MAESTLSLGYPDIASEVAKKLGLPTDAADRSAAEIALIDDIMQSGVRQFYFPPILPGEEHVHQWSFLKPTTTLATVADDYDYDLPDAFGYIDGELTFAASDNQGGPLKKVGEGQIRVWREAGGDDSGVPSFYAVRPKSATAGTTGQRWELLLWPTPDAIYTLSYKYAALAGAISTGSPYPLGGMSHAETVLQSCLAVAEMRDMGVHGPEWEGFIDRLRTSVSLDRSHAPEYFGFCGDPGIVSQERSRIDGYVSYNSVNYPT